MPIAKITGQGLLAIGCATVLLWTCLLAERDMMRRAIAERAAVMRTVKHQPQKAPQPVSEPSVFPRRVRRPVAG